jgi:hypothetical protein
MSVLQKKILPLRAELKRLTDAHTYLCELKWAAERELVGVTKVKMKESGRKKAKKELSIEQIMAVLTPDQKKRFIEATKKGALK